MNANEYNGMNTLLTQTLKEQALALGAIREMLAEYDSANELGAVILCPTEAIKKAREAYKMLTGTDWNPMDGNYAPKL